MTLKCNYCIDQRQTMQYQLNKMTGRFLWIKIPAWLVLLGLIYGCQTAPVVPEPEPPPPPEPVAEPEPEPPPPVPLATDLKSVIELMQNGEAQLASDSLKVLITEETNPRVMNSLLQQLQTDAKQIFGDEHYEVTVQAGDTLSALAGQHMGDPLQFYALASYNDIAVPRLLEVGRQLKIPVRGSVAFNDGRSELERIGIYLIASGDTDAAWRALLQAADNGRLSESGQQELFDLSLSISDQQIQNGEPEQAVETLQQTADRFTAGAYQADLQAQLIRLQATAVQE